MNILSHLFLSKGINQLMLGNFMGDFVKGNSYLNYSQPIQNGILLHRHIDSVTDNHIAHKTSRERFREKFGLHSGIVTDIIYDHFLAQQWDKRNKNTLEDYAQNVYAYLQSNMEIIPVRLAEYSSIMIANNWLVMYKSMDGIERVLSGMARRTSLPSQIPFAMDVLNKHYENFAFEFDQIIEDLLILVENSLYLANISSRAN